MDAVEKAVANVESPKDIYSDIYNARVFKELWKEKIRWSRDYGGWFIYNGKYWQRDCNDLIKMYAIKTHAHMMTDVGKVKDKKYFTHLKNSAADNKLNAMLSCSRAYLGAMSDDFDKNYYYFNCKNGTLDLFVGDGVLQSHRHSDLITRYSDVEYNPDATCPMWLKFLNDIFLGKQEIIDFMQRVIGYSMTGSTQEQCLFILYGRGRNGKSRFLETLYHLFGDYTMNCPASTFIKKQNVSIPNDIARLKGARMVTAVENNQNVSFDESIIKHLTGQDRISARFLNKEFFDFSPTFKIFFATNHKPNIRGTDDGIWRRIKMIPFDLRVTDEMDDRKLGEKLKTELSGILNWALAGCKEWMRAGLQTPNVIHMATQEYKDEEDQIGMFIKDFCVLDKDAHIQVTEFKTRLIEYAGWKISQKQIASYMESCGFKDRGDNRITVDGAKIRVYKGLRFVQQHEHAPDAGWTQ